MRFTTLLAGFALFSSAFAAQIPAKTIRGLGIPSERSLKQFNPLASIEEKRGLLDICIDVKVDLLVELNKIFHANVPVSGAGGDVDLCLCVGLLPTFVDLHLTTKLFVGLFGKDVVLNALIDLLLNAPGKKECHYPDHAVQLCESGNPCGYDCKDGYTKQGDKCVCAPGKVECGGKCQLQTYCPPPPPTQSGSLSNNPYQHRARSWSSTGGSFPRHR